MPEPESTAGNTHRLKKQTCLCQRPQQSHKPSPELIHAKMAEITA